MCINGIKSISFRKECASKILFSIFAIVISIIWLSIVISMHILQKEYYGYEMYKTSEYDKVTDLSEVFDEPVLTVKGDVVFVLPNLKK